MLLSIGTDTLYIIEITVSFETNIDLNAERKHNKYLQLTHDLSSMYRCIRLINLSISALGIFGNSCKSFVHMSKDLDVKKQYMKNILRNTTNIIIRSRTTSSTSGIKPGPTLTSLYISYMTRTPLYTYFTYTSFLVFC